MLFFRDHSNYAVCLYVLVICFSLGCTSSYYDDVVCMDWKHTVKQKSLNDCGPTCLKMIFDDFNVDISLPRLKTEMSPSVIGVTMYALKKTAERNGLSVKALKVDEYSILNVKKPIIVHLKAKHFVVVDSIDINRYVHFRDPMRGRCKMNIEDFFYHTNGISLIFEK